MPDLLRLTPHARPWWVRLLCLVGAALLFVAGIAGWLIPVVTGIPFYLAALVLLGLASNRAGAWINRLERRLPERWRRALRRGLGKIPSETLRRVIQVTEDAEWPRPGG